MDELTVALVAIALMLAGGIGIIAADTKTVHEYTVKSEQVEASHNISASDVTSYSELSSDEQKALHQAFKKSDHFLDGASAEIESDEKLNSSNEWQVVEVDGAYILVSIHHTDSEERFTSVFGWVGV